MAKLKTIVFVAGVMLLILAAAVGYLSIKYLSAILPADSYEDKGVYTFLPYQVLPVQVQNTGASGRDRRMNPTKTAYMVYYRDTSGSGYQWSEQALTRELGQDVVDAGAAVERRVLAIPADRSYITVEPGQTAESYTAGLRPKYITALVLLVLLSAPTGWLYDLRAGEGTGQGQRPSADVQRLRRQEDIETFFLSSTPATVNGGELVACPLARLRDVAQEGVHTHHNSGVKRSVSVSEYIYADYPLPPFQRFIQGFAGGYYNRYYLAELADGSWLCAFFDDYLVWTEVDNYPTGYVRYTTTEERRMLNRMAEDYDVNPAYVLDMYQHGKVNWMLDVLLRLAVCVVAAVIVWGIKKAVSNRKVL